MESSSSSITTSRRKRSRRKRKLSKEEDSGTNSAVTQRDSCTAYHEETETATLHAPKRLKPDTANHQKTHENHQRRRHAFEVDESDHCETPLQAYQDILPLLDWIADSLGKTRRSLIVYDPYYCDGGVKTKLASLGFSKVVNENQDFYKNVKGNSIPAHDVLLTNPPYSGHHMEQLLSFAASNKKPFLLLLPHYVYTKDYYSRSLGPITANKVFYIIPQGRYSYIPPSWVSSSSGSTALIKGKTQTAPFPSFWYSFGISDEEFLSRTFHDVNKKGSFCPAQKLHYANCTAHIPRDFKGEFDGTKKRPNPRVRKRAAAAKKRNINK